ncbi:hypothetical protein C3432_05670 [Citrobacter amalonaticus]|uniref:Uncharacterized protein n=1 Tax=Citrobacter amalonaticus TaxID=35703 RepID=A0A2S4RQK8_CITAM|nr:hypothetical protein C3432_05670 [Citrobacter amalonaticus]POT77021.1 hypothetical protein C3436_06150 [Citrobacter amalonaticus]POU60148.1 hypothetical protein C3430_25575 [Citrobacter amalonaticus]POV06256.1 hypothetical protein C3424_13450 [Citrobacter amalonaticus]
MALNHVLPLRLSELSALRHEFKTIIPLCRLNRSCFADLLINTFFGARSQALFSVGYREFVTVLFF